MQEVAKKSRFYDSVLWLAYIEGDHTKWYWKTDAICQSDLVTIVF